MRTLFLFLISINLLFAFSLRIKTEPMTSDIQIVNIEPKYFNGIELNEGKYDILIRKDGYKESRFYLYLEKDTNITVELERLKVHRLVVNTIPIDANIKVMNIYPKYKEPMFLLDGRYDILVEKDGFKTSREWIDIKKDTILNIKLNPIISQKSKDRFISKSVIQQDSIISDFKADENISIKTKIPKIIETKDDESIWVKLSENVLNNWKREDISDNEIRLSPNRDIEHRIFVLFPKKSQAYDTAINKILDVFTQKEIWAEVTLFFYKDIESLGLKAIKRVKKDKFDLILSMGSQSTDFLYKNFKGESIPVVSVCSKDPVLLNQVENYEVGSGNNFAFTSLGLPIKIQLDYLKKLIYNLENIVIMYSKDNKSAITTQVEPLKKLAIADGLNILEVVLDDRHRAKEELSYKVAKVSDELLNLDPSAKKSIFWITGSTSVFKEIETINANTKNFPVVSIVPDIVNGSPISAVVSIGVSFSSNAHLAALYSINILKQGIKAKDLKVGIVFPPDISINFLKSKEINMQIPFELFEISTIVYGLNGEKL